jgi:hypothetical protein
MTPEDKVKKYDEIAKALWDAARGGHPLQSIMAANIIRQFEIESPEGDGPEDA